MTRMFVSRLNIPFIPIESVQTVVENIIARDPDESFMLYFVPNSVEIETGFRVPSTPVRQPLLEYQEQAHKKTKWVVEDSLLNQRNFYDFLDWNQVIQGYQNLTDSIERMESKKYMVTEFYMGLRPKGCHIKLSVNFPKKGEFAISCHHENRKFLGKLLESMSTNIPLSHREHGGYQPLPIDNWS